MEYKFNIIKNISEFKEEDLKPTSSFELQKELNPDTWDDLKMKPNVRERLLEISNEYLNSVKFEYEVHDVILLGSLASYNWSEYSDFDVHIIVDYTDINPELKLVEEFLKIHKKLWNEHFDITVMGFDVELYVENKGIERDHVNGIYSLKKDKWNVRPEPINVEIDEKLIEQKAIELMESVDDIELAIDENDYDDTKEKIDKVWAKIKKQRKDGIASPDGEFSIGNLVFKYLRRNEYISKIIDIKKKLVEKKYSLYGEDD